MKTRDQTWRLMDSRGAVTSHSASHPAWHTDEARLRNICGSRSNFVKAAGP